MDGSTFETVSAAADFLSSTLGASLVGFGEPNKKLLAGVSVVDLAVLSAVESKIFHQIMSKFNIIMQAFKP